MNMKNGQLYGPCLNPVEAFNTPEPVAGLLISIAISHLHILCLHEISQKIRHPVIDSIMSPLLMELCIWVVAWVCWNCVPFPETEWNKYLWRKTKWGKGWVFLPHFSPPSLIHEETKLIHSLKIINNSLYLCIQLMLEQVSWCTEQVTWRPRQESSLNKQINED